MIPRDDDDDGDNDDDDDDNNGRSMNRHGRAHSFRRNLYGCDRHRRRLSDDRICVYLNVPRYGTYRGVYLPLHNICRHSRVSLRETHPDSGTGVVPLLVYRSRRAGDFLEVASARSEVVYAGK